MPLMIEMVRRARQLLVPSDEFMALSFFRLEVLKLYRLLFEGRAGAFLGSTAELASGWNPYFQLRSADSQGFPHVDVNGYRMVVDARDEGISRTLLAFGVHEYVSTKRFARELTRLRADIDGPVTVLEIGANIGYFCLLEANMLGKAARIYAIEPVPTNVDLLERNISMNRCDDAVTVDRCALGEWNGPVEIELSTHSNHHRVRHPELVGGTEAVARQPDIMTVEQASVSDYLADRDVDPGSVNVVRMDIEGYEHEVVRGMADILEAPGPTLIFIEIHPINLSREAAQSVVTALEENGFRIISVVMTEAAAGVPSGRRWHGLTTSIDEFTDLRQVIAENDHAIELLTRKD